MLQPDRDWPSRVCAADTGMTKAIPNIALPKADRDHGQLGLESALMVVRLRFALTSGIRERGRLSKRFGQGRVASAEVPH